MNLSSAWTAREAACYHSAPCFSTVHRKPVTARLMLGSGSGFICPSAAYLGHPTVPCPFVLSANLPTSPAAWGCGLDLCGGCDNAECRGTLRAFRAGADPALSLGCHKEPALVGPGMEVVPKCLLGYQQLQLCAGVPVLGGRAGVHPLPGALQVASCPCTMWKWGHATCICACWCLQRGLCLAAISMLVLSPAGAAAAGIEVWLGEGLMWEMSGAGTARLVWPGMLQGVCRAATMCSARWDSWKCVAPAPDTGSSPAQPCWSGAVEVAWPTTTCCGAELLTVKLGGCCWVLTHHSAALEQEEVFGNAPVWGFSPSSEGFGVTKERCECACTLSAFTAPCTRSAAKFYLLGMGSVLNFTGTAAPLVLPLEGWRVRVMLLGAVGWWIRARSCAEHRVGETHMLGCKHVCERDPGCLNNVKY